MKTGLPRRLTVMHSPILSLEMSTSSDAIASTSAAGFIWARNLIRQRRQAEAEMNLAPPTAAVRSSCRLRKRGGSGTRLRAQTPRCVWRAATAGASWARRTDHRIVERAVRRVGVAHARLMRGEALAVDKLARVDRGDVAAARRCAARHLRLLRRRRDAQTAQRAKRRRAEARSCLSQRLSEHCGRPDAKEILSGQSPLPDTRRPSRELGLRLRLRLRKRGCGRERAAAQERGRAPLLLRSPHLSQRSKVIAITFSGKPSPASPFAVSCLNIAGLCKKN